jgi:diguanylate cyclase (GGDEF)-like protein
MSPLLPTVRKLLLRWDVWALVLVIAMEGLVCVEFFATMQQSQQLAEPDIGDNSWQTYQLDLELYRFDNSLLEFLRGTADADTVGLRLDILASRLLPAYQQGSIQSTPAALQALKGLSRKVDSWTGEVSQLVGDRRIALTVAERLHRDVRAQERWVLNLSIHEAQTLRVDQVRRQLHHRFTRLTTIFGLLGLGVTLFVGILMVRSSREKRLTQNLAHLNEHLETKVVERTQALEEQTEMLNMILEASPVGVALLNESTQQLVFANTTLLESLDLPRAQPHEMPLQGIFANPADELAFWQKLEEQGTVHNHEAELLNAQGRLFGLITAKRFNFSQKPKQLIWIYDISERKQLENRLRELATYDSLTGAVNRATFLEALTLSTLAAQQSERPLSLLSLDLDHFKHINDTYGHPVGDQALRQLAQLVQSTLRKQDVLGRLGGEEFCIVLAETSTFDAERMAERIRALIEASAIELAEGQRLHFTLSIGVTSLQLEDSSEALLKRADNALYRAKKSGRNRIAIDA